MDNDFQKLFPYFEQNKKFTYLDSANTSQILGSCLSSMIKVYSNYNYNIGRASYSGARWTQQLKDWSLKVYADFIGTKPDNIILTTGATEGLNLIAYSYCSMLHKIKKKAVLLTTKLEHASAIMPWMVFGKNIVDIKYIDLKEDYTLSIENFNKAVEEYNPDIVLLSSMTNTTGEIRPIKEIGAITKEKHITFIVDHAQGAAHVPINVTECNIDFLVFSLHKMYGPKGIGVLYAKIPNFIRPMKVGGGMNKYFIPEGEFEFLDSNDKMYAGTENVPSAFAGTDAALTLSQSWDIIQMQDLYLGLFAHRLLSKLPKIKIYSNPQSPILLFNIDGFEALDVMNYLDKKNIFIRAGNHCSKLTKDLFGLSTCRVSLGIYNSEEDLMKLYKALKEMESEVLCLENVQDQKTVESENVEQISVR